MQSCVKRKCEGSRQRLPDITVGSMGCRSAFVAPQRGTAISLPGPQQMKTVTSNCCSLTQVPSDLDVTSASFSKRSRRLDSPNQGKVWGLLPQAGGLILTVPVGPTGLAPEKENRVNRFESGLPSREGVVEPSFFGGQGPRAHLVSQLAGSPRSGMILEGSFPHSLRSKSQVGGLYERAARVAAHRASWHLRTYEFSKRKAFGVPSSRPQGNQLQKYPAKPVGSLQREPHHRHTGNPGLCLTDSNKQTCQAKVSCGVVLLKVTPCLDCFF